MPAAEAAWNALLDAYGYRITSALDLALLDGLQNGYFDPDLIQRHGSELDSQLKAAQRQDSFRQPWRLYHDSFDDNRDQVCDGIYNAAVQNLRLMSAMDLDSAVSVLKELGQEA